MRCKIIYEDEKLIVIHKPANMATQSADVMSVDVVSEIRGYLKAPYLGIVHRLDQPVEGLLVFAKDKKTAAALSGQLESGKLKKQYLVLAADCREKSIREDTSPGEGDMIDISSLMKKDSRSRCALVRDIRALIKDQSGGSKELYKGSGYVSKTDADSDGWKAAHTVCRVLEADSKKGAYKCRVEISTGRFHQIRAHLSSISFPLLGDRKYGCERSEELAGIYGVYGLALIADRLVFEHPSTRRIFEFSLGREDLPAWFFRS